MKWWVLLILIVFLSACGSSLDHRIQEDAYLAYTYPDEDLPAGLTYRKIDYYTNVLLLEDAYGVKDPDSAAMREQLQEFLDWAQDAGFSNTIQTQEGGKDVALDTYCIVGWLFNDTAAAEKVAGAITHNNLIDDTYYTEDAWRNLADEAWCIMLLGKTGVDQDEAAFLVEDKIHEGRAFLKTDASAVDKSGIVLHMLLMLHAYPGLADEKAYWVDKGVAYLDDPALQENNLVLANLADALLSYPDTEQKVKPTIDLLKSRETGDIWVPVEGMEPGYGQLFATSRVELALYHYEQATTGLD